jgi:adenylate cyclase
MSYREKPLADDRVQRRLAAILAADVAGYSRLMGEDEEGTLAALTEHLSELIEPCIAGHRGRVVKTTGDGLLAEFASVVDAVKCAVAFQEGMAARNAGVDADRRIAFRIGVNLGDVIVQGDDVFGEGVNVAARLEGFAEPGSVIVSGTVHEHVRGKLDVEFRDLGAQKVKNIAEPVRAFRIDPAAEPRADLDQILPLPDKPSIAVLAFENMSGDPEQEYFADGIAEDIITALSRFGWFFVIARNSSFSYKGSSPDIRQVARELGVQYVLEGSVRKAANRVRITAQLIDALSGRHIWAERFDRDLDDIFAVQDELTEAIVVAVAPSFVSAEAKRIERKSPEQFDVWDYAMRGNWHLLRRSREDVARARRLFEAALDLDPKSTMALSGLAVTLFWSINFAWVDDVPEARETALAAARAAVALDEMDAEAHVALGVANFYMPRLDASVSACRRALELNPNFSMAEAWLSIALSWRGDYEEAAVHAETATRLSPRDIMSVGNFAHTCTEFGAGRYESCIEWAGKTLQSTPEFPAPWRYLTASLAHLDRMDEARVAKDRLVELMPYENLKLVRAALPSENLDRMERFVEGLRKAGLPEGD